MNTRPILWENEYFDNDANNYGGNIASDPIKIKILNLNSEMFSLLTSAKIYPDNDNYIIKNLSLGFFDFDDQLVKTNFQIRLGILFHIFKVVITFLNMRNNKIINFGWFLYKYFDFLVKKYPRCCHFREN